MKKSVHDTDDGFANFGKPVPMYRRKNADEHCIEMGLSDTNKRMTIIQTMCEAIERDKPYEAMEAGMAFLDLTGTYRLMAVLLVSEEPVHIHPDYIST